MILNAIIRAYQDKYKRNWDTIYFAIDLHGTIIKKYTGDDIKVYEKAAEALRFITVIPGIIPILYTSTSPDNLKPFYKWCSENGIIFKYLNENPECPSNKTGDFSKKFYFNVLLDDRAGFNPDTDWLETITAIKTAEIMFKCPKMDICRRSLEFSADPWMCRTCSKNDYILDEKV